jgi:hypothetical protein
MHWNNSDSFKLFLEENCLYIVTHKMLRLRSDIQQT